MFENVRAFLSAPNLGFPTYFDYLRPEVASAVVVFVVETIVIFGTFIKTTPKCGEGNPATFKLKFPHRPSHK